MPLQRTCSHQAKRNFSCTTLSTNAPNQLSICRMRQIRTNREYCKCVANWLENGQLLQEPVARSLPQRVNRILGEKFRMRPQLERLGPTNSSFGLKWMQRISADARIVLLMSLCEDYIRARRCTMFEMSVVWRSKWIWLNSAKMHVALAQVTGP